jgi:hypothetical protein
VPLRVPPHSWVLQLAVLAASTRQSLILCQSPSMIALPKCRSHSAPSPHACLLQGGPGCRVPLVDGWFVHGFDVRHGGAVLPLESGAKLLRMYANGFAAHLDASQCVAQSSGLAKRGDGTQRRLPMRLTGACLLIARQTTA